MAVQRHDRDGGRHVVRRHGREHQRRWRRSCRPTRTSKDSCRRWAPVAGIDDPTRDAFFIHLSDPSERCSADDVARELTRKLAAIPGTARIHAESAADQHRRPLERRASISSRCRRQHRRALPTAGIMEQKMPRRLPELRDVTSDLQIKNPQMRSTSTAIARRRSASPRHRSRTRCTTPTARGRSRPSIRRTISTGS